MPETASDMDAATDREGVTMNKPTVVAMNRTGSHLTIAGLAAVLALAPPSAPAQQLYRLTDLGTLGGPRSTAVDINNAGQVTGESLLADGSIHAFRVKAGRKMVDLGTLASCEQTDNLGWESTGNGINSSGQVAGTSCQMTGPTRAFVATPGEAKVDLGTLPGGYSSWAYAINNSGLVTGFASTPVDGRNVARAFRAGAGMTMEDLGACPPRPSRFPG